MSSIRLRKNVIERKKKSVMKVGVVAGVLLIWYVSACASQDRTAPVFDFTDASSVYNASDLSQVDTAQLLSEVTASDNRDGDLTDSIIIKSLVQNNDSSITVVYMVRDHSGNVAEQERIYNYTLDEVSGGSNQEESSGEETSSLQESEETTPEGERGTSETSAPESSETEPETEPVTEPVTEPSSEVQTEPVTDTAAQTESAQTSQKPYIVLTSSEAHVPVGTKLVYTDYIAEMWDDVDDQGYLYNSIWIENWDQVDWNVPGVYTIVFRLVDSDTNISDGQALTVYVE